MPTMICPKCSASLRVPAGLHGHASCPQCKALIEVPAPDSEDAPRASLGITAFVHSLRLIVWACLALWLLWLMLAAPIAAKVDEDGEAISPARFGLPGPSVASWAIPGFAVAYAFDKALLALLGR